MRHVRASIRFILLLLWVALGMSLGSVTYLLARDGFHTKVVMFFNRGALIIAGVKVTLQGEVPKQAQGTLFVANHCSYLDIPVYGAFIPVCYTPKADIRRWPVIGLLTVIARSIFIQREKGASAAQKAKLLEALAEGNNILLFPEGTTNDGGGIKPFKSALFAVAEPEEGKPDIRVQPLALRYSEIKGKPPKGGRMMDRVAWYGDMTLLPHLWALLSMQTITAEVNILPLVAWKGDRKAMALTCEEMVRAAA